jgi:hypothetical protein
MASAGWGILPRMRPRCLATPAAAALVAALSILAAAPAVGSADETIGSSLQSEPTVTKEATQDSVYWEEKLPGGASAAVKTAGTVRSVTIRGYWNGKGIATIHIQVLRPQSDGSLLVVETSAPFEMPATPGQHTFYPENMTAQPGDFIGIATEGGGFVIGANAAGAVTNDFEGHEKDMNGDEVRPTKVEENVELVTQIDIYVKEEAKKEEKKKEEPPPPPKPCKCLKLTVELDKTLVRKRLPSNRHKFGVGFAWRMTCTEGAGGCEGQLEFRPPEILAGTLPKTRGLKLNISRTSFLCKTACKTSTQGHIEIKMRSRNQLNRLFGRTLAFTIYVYCGGTTFRYQVNVPVTKSGRLRSSTLTFTRVP